MGIDVFGVASFATKGNTRDGEGVVMIHFIIHDPDADGGKRGADSVFLFTDDARALAKQILMQADESDKDALERH